jgi:hypothetical protein
MTMWALILLVYTAMGPQQQVYRYYDSSEACYSQLQVLEAQGNKGYCTPIRKGPVYSR